MSIYVGGGMQVSICVITYKRPEGLTRLLEGLNQLHFSRIPEPDISVVLVDNDVNQSAYPVYASLQARFKYGLTYTVESRRGISHARNCSVNCAQSDSQFIAFIDDDEVPEPTWLEELLVVQDTYQADIVHGPVLPNFQSDVPSWVREGNFFAPRRYDTGHRLDAAYTHNLLVRAELLKARQPVFDERFSLTGGEDSYLFRTLHHQGCRLVWANEAVVHEWVPSTRTTMKWILMRAYRGCLSYTTWEREVKGSIRLKLLSCLKGMAQIGMGLCLLGPSVFLSNYLRMKALLNIYQGAGRLSGLIGINYEEYKEIHGI